MRARSRPSPTTGRSSAAPAAPAFWRGGRGGRMEFRNDRNAYQPRLDPGRKRQASAQPERGRGRAAGDGGAGRTRGDAITTLTNNKKGSIVGGAGGSGSYLGGAGGSGRIEFRNDRNSYQPRLDQGRKRGRQRDRDQSSRTRRRGRVEFRDDRSARQQRRDRRRRRLAAALRRGPRATRSIAPAPMPRSGRSPTAARSSAMSRSTTRRT